jgi:hypothetical protein
VRRLTGAALALLIAACTAPRPQLPVASAPTPVEERLATIHAAAGRSEHESDARVRTELADDARREAEACLAAQPHAAACLYGHAIAQGLEARAHPARAGESLKQMLADLQAADATDASYDDAGPARVTALVLTRAPGWPLGPGDPQAGVAAARRAVSLAPQYPPNLLALAEALARSADAAGAHQAYQRAHDAALALPASAERDEWLQQAAQGLQH